MVYTWDMTFVFFKNFKPMSFSNIRSTAYKSPHTAKFHAAPCHSPVKNHTTNMLNIHLAFLTRFPPSGMYT